MRPGPAAHTVAAIRIERRGSAIQVSVKDQGIGIPPEHLEHVFERFYRVDKARTRKASTPAPRGADPASVPHSGAGLGLAIVSALVSAHNGTVAVHTAPGEGATFQVRLPLAPMPRASQ